MKISSITKTNKLTVNKDNSYFWKYSFKADLPDTFEKSSNGETSMTNSLNELQKEINKKVKYAYPKEFVTLFNTNQSSITEDWQIIKDKNFVIERMDKIKELYKTENLVPFARKPDTTVMACFETDCNKIAIVNLHAPDEYFYVDEYENIQDWLDANKEEK